MWSLTTGVRRFTLFALVTFAALCFQAPAFAGGRTVFDRVMEGNGVALGFGADETTGTQFDTTIQHVFSLLCDVMPPGIAAGRPYRPDFLEIYWNDLAGFSYSFKLKQLTTTTCSKPTMLPSFLCDPFIVDDCFDTIVGEGTGSLSSTAPGGTNCSNCGMVTFNFTDNGPAKTGSLTQPTPYDVGSFQVNHVVSGTITNLILDGCSACPLSKADYRARQRGTCAS